MLPPLLLQSAASPLVSSLRPYYLALNTDLVGGTFFYSMFALFGGALFLFLERGNVPRRWHASMTLAGIICFVAGVNYYYMQGMYLNTGQGPTRSRYADWLFTVPMMCTQFYLLLRPAGARPSSLHRHPNRRDLAASTPAVPTPEMSRPTPSAQAILCPPRAATRSSSPTGCGT